MVIKLKSSIRYEVFLVMVWIVWSIMLTLTTNFFNAMEILVGKACLYVRACVIGGTIGTVILGIVLLWSTGCYLSSIWKMETYQPVVLERVPCELWAVVILGVAPIWYSDEIYGCINGYWWTYLETGRLYYLLSGFLHEFVSQGIMLAVMWFALWILVRQICYHRVSKSSLFCRMVIRYRQSSALGKKIIRKRWILTLLIAVSMAFAVLGILCAMDGYLEGVAVICCLLYGICQIGVILYLRMAGIMTTDIHSLVEQIGAVFRGEPLHEEFRVTETSLYYEPFHQLEELEEAVQRSAKKQVQAERLKVDLITNVSHDLKTPLTSMVGYTDLLKQEELRPEARDYVNIISMKQEQLTEMIQQLFELSKATSGVEPLKLEPLDMRKLVEQILGDMEDCIRHSGQTIRSTFDDSPLLFIGDNEKAYRVVQNLLENALKYSLEHTRIYITVNRVEKRLVLQMKNVASYEMNFEAGEMIERFVRGDSSRTTEGHGLGLAIASSFTQNMGGSLTVDTDGDLFKVTVEFPVATASL